MNDIDTVVKGIECLLSPRKCDLLNCPYGTFDKCIDAVLHDALELLKTMKAEQERRTNKGSFD